MASAAAIRADARSGGAYLRTDPSKADGRVRQLQTMAGYAFGRNETTRHIIDSTHNVRTLARNFRDGQAQDHTPNTLDYFRTGAAMSGFGSSPWLAMRLSPSLRAAYDQIGGSPGYSGHPLGLGRDADGAPVGNVHSAPRRQIVEPPTDGNSTIRPNLNLTTQHQPPTHKHHAERHKPRQQRIHSLFHSHRTRPNPNHHVQQDSNLSATSST